MIGPLSYADTRTDNFLDGQKKRSPRRLYDILIWELGILPEVNGARARVMLDQKRELLDGVADELLD